MCLGLLLCPDCYFQVLFNQSSFPQLLQIRPCLPKSELFGFAQQKYYVQYCHYKLPSVVWHNINDTQRSQRYTQLSIMKSITIADFCSAPSVITVPFQMYSGCILSAFQNQFDSVPVFCTTLARSASSLAGKAGKHYVINDNYYDI